MVVSKIQLSVYNIMMPALCVAWALLVELKKLVFTHKK